jgi:hypothetical protein
MQTELIWRWPGWKKIANPNPVGERYYSPVCPQPFCCATDKVHANISISEVQLPAPKTKGVNEVKILHPGPKKNQADSLGDIYLLDISLILLHDSRIRIGVRIRKTGKPPNEWLPNAPSTSQRSRLRDFFREKHPNKTKDSPFFHISKRKEMCTKSQTDWSRFFRLSEFCGASGIRIPLTFTRESELQDH